MPRRRSLSPHSPVKASEDDTRAASTSLHGELRRVVIPVVQLIPITRAEDPDLNGIRTLRRCGWHSPGYREGTILAGRECPVVEPLLPDDLPIWVVDFDVDKDRHCGCAGDRSGRRHGLATHDARRGSLG